MVCCQRTASGFSDGIHMLDAFSSKKGSLKSRRSTNSTSISPRACACLKIHWAGLSAKRVGRVEPTMTAIRGFTDIVTSCNMVSNCYYVGGSPLTNQEGTRALPGAQEDTATCQHISQMLARMSDKWTILVVRTLGRGPLRFNALRREVGEISQKMLSSTLRDLEENGFVTRTVTPTVPPQVEYELTKLGRDFLTPVHGLASWVVANTKNIDAARTAYAAKKAAE